MKSLHRTLMALSITLTIVGMAACTAVISTHSLKESPHIEIGGVSGGATTTNQRVLPDGRIFCELYELPEFPIIPPIEDKIGDMDELDKNPRLAIDRLLQYIKLRDNVINEFRKERRDRYEVYLRKCLTFK